MLTLDTLIDLACAYRKTLPGDTPIAFALDGEGAYALQAERATAGYLEGCAGWEPGTARLLRITVGNVGATQIHYRAGSLAEVKQVRRLGEVNQLADGAQAALILWADDAP